MFFNILTNNILRHINITSLWYNCHTVDDNSKTIKQIEIGVGIEWRNFNEEEIMPNRLTSLRTSQKTFLGILSCEGENNSIKVHMTDTLKRMLILNLIAEW